MTSKRQEFEMRQALESLEELATFIGYHCDCSGIRILSVESLHEAEQREWAEQSENVVLLPSPQPADTSSNISKSLFFEDRLINP
jgi:hypothetical protein